MKKATLGQASYLLDLCREKDVPSERLQALIDRGLIADLLDADPTKVDRTAFRKMLGLEESRWTQLRNAMGIPDEDIWPQFTEQHFPLGTKPAYEYDLEVVDFGRELSDEELLADIKKLGAKLPEPEDGMSYAASHPEEYKERPIVVRLARPWVDQHGHELVFYFYCLERERFLSRSYVLNGWSRDYRFLVRRPRK